MSVLELILGGIAMCLLAMLAFLLRVLVALATKDATALAVDLAHRIARRAAKRLPPEAKSRYTEEWEGDLELLGTERPLAAILAALRIWRRSGVLARERDPGAEPALDGLTIWILAAAGVGFVATLMFIVMTIFTATFADDVRAIKHYQHLRDAIFAWYPAAVVLLAVFSGIRWRQQRNKYDEASSGEI